MPNAPKFIESVPVGRIFLRLDNPRHKPVETESMAIAQLCKEEAIYPMARDIAKIGINPLDNLGLVPVKTKTSGANASYISAEGNRRICALKLLNDPELAPANLRKAFKELAAGSVAPSTVPAKIFDDFESARPWLDRIHNGEQGGIGRTKWNAEQKQRFDGGSKNKAAQALLDYAEAENMLSAEEREGKLTTVQRFLGNDIFRETLGFDQSTPDDVGRTRPKDEFDILVKRFIRDLIQKKEVNSRMNKDDIIRYARPLASIPGVTATRVEAESLSTGVAGKTKKNVRKKPRKPEKVKHIQYEEEIFAALKNLENEKLSSLYHSICTIELDPHTPLVAIGTWSLFETLTACAGRHDGTSIDSFISKNRLVAYGFTGDTLSLRSAMTRIREYGNTTKHHPIAAIFNGDQLNNDMTALKSVILKCIEEAAANTK
jgi:hypothetical protein